MADVGHRFSLILSREITEEELVVLKEAGCFSAIFATDSFPANADMPVTRLDFDDTVSRSLAEALEAALEAVKVIPELSVPSLNVPAQPAVPAPAAAEPAVEATSAGQSVTEVPTGKNASSRKTVGKKSVAKKASAVEPVAEVEQV